MRGATKDALNYDDDFGSHSQMRTTMEKRDTPGVRNLATSDVRDGLLLLLSQVIVQVLNYELILCLYSYICTSTNITYSYLHIHEYI